MICKNNINKNNVVFSTLASRYEGFYNSDVKSYNLNKDIAQMDNGVITDFESKVSIVPQSTTQFVDSGTTQVGSTSRPTTHVSTYVETYADIKAFLAKPYLLQSTSWTTANAANFNLYNASIAFYLTNIPLWYDKIKGFNLIRGDFVVRVVLNSSPFQQGKLLLHYLPNYADFVTTNINYGKFKNKHLTQKVQHPHVEIDCRRTSVDMRIPYVAPSAFYAIKENTYDWGTIFLDVFSALKTGSAAPVSQGYVDVSIYGYWENVELAAPAVPQSSSKVIVRRNGEIESKEAEGPIASGLKKVGKVAKILSDVPTISSYIKPIEWVTNLMAESASVMGWSKPRELAGQTNVYQQLYRYAGTCDGPDAAFPGGMSCLNKLETIDYASFTNEDEMSLNYLYSVPYYVGEITWSDVAGVGTSLLSQVMSPVSFLNTGADTVNGHTTAYEYHVPFTQLARFHNWWRGSLILTLKFVKTQMHSGRLQVTWTPTNNSYTGGTIYTGAFNKRAIIDVSTEEVVSLELPYLLQSDYAPLFAAGGMTNASGVLDIQVLNDLRAPESCSNEVAIQWFISAGPDYELAAPCDAKVAPVPYVPQSDGTILVKDSIEQGAELITAEIGGVNTRTDHVFHSKRCVGEKIMSIKNYLLRNSVLQGYLGSTFNFQAGNGLVVDPYFIGASVMNNVSGTLGSSLLVGDAFSLVSSWYAFMRGGIRMSFVNLTGQDMPISSNVSPHNGTFTTAPVKNGATNLNAYSGNLCSLAAASEIYPFQPTNIIEKGSHAYQHIPYYNNFPVALNTYYDGTLSVATNHSKPPIYWQVRTGTGNIPSPFSLQRSVADDFQLSFFTGCPCLVVAYS